MHAPNRFHLMISKQTLINHLGGPCTTLFCRLEDKIDSAVKITCFRKIPGRSQEHGHMPIMATGMHTAFYF